ncbi:MAG: hypothetical protein IH986_12895 [Planctomycetes bacterium]|nr:hypothetical protein [Planctomycetota bacterium]
MPNVAQPVAAMLDDNGCVAIDVACLNCGYNLRTQPVSGACPECAQEVRYSTSGYVVRLDADGRIANDLACITCGYNLRLQPATGTCPECGNRVAPSTRGFYLRFGPPQWVARLSRGVLLVAIALVGLVFVELATVFSSLLLAAGPPGSAYTAVVIGFLLMIAGLAILGIVGVFFTTSRDPVSRETPKRISARAIARLSAWLAPSLGVCAFLSVGAASILTAGRSPFQVLYGFFTISCVFVCIIVFPLSFTRRLGELMRRIPRSGLARYARIQFWLYASTSTLVFVGYVLGTLMFPRTSTAMTATAVTTSMPASAFAGGAAAAPSGALGFTGSGTIATSAPSGTTLITTSGPVALSPRARGRMIGASIAGLFGCGWFLVGISTFVLLILAQRALAGAAKDAAANAAGGMGAAPFESVPRP